MPFLDQLSEELDSPTAIWNLFASEYTPNEKAVFVIHEGRDDPSFYRSHVEARMPRGWGLNFVCCGTKKEVLERSAEFAALYAANPRALFCVDKDHDDLIGANVERPYRWTYTTSSYAIENYLCCPQVVRAFLTDIAGMPDMDPACDAIANRYEESKSELHRAGMPLMAWIVAVRRQGLSLNLNNIDTGKLFNVTDELTSELADGVPALHEYLATTTGGHKPNPSPPDEDIQSAMDQLKDIKSDAWFRGKQDLWFLVKFLLKAVELLRESKKKIKVGVQLNQANALQFLGPKAPLPDCLASFLEEAFAEL